LLPAFLALIKDDAGAELSEYVLLVTIIALMAYMTVKMLGHGVKNLFNTAANSV